MGKNISKYADYELEEANLYEKSVVKFEHATNWTLVNPQSNLQQLILKGWKKENFYAYNMTKAPVGINEYQRGFLFHMQKVVANNYYKRPNESLDESLLDNLWQYILSISGFNDFQHYTTNIHGTRLQLKVGNHIKDIAIPDVHVKRGRYIYWIIVEDKHNRNSRGADAQLIATLIAAAQENRRVFGESYNKTLIGVYSKGTEVRFIIPTSNSNYLNELEYGIPKNNKLQINHYPKDTFLDLCNENDRVQLFKILETIKQQGLKIPLF